MSQRNYPYKDVDMLMAAETIVQSLATNLSELSTIRTNWTEAYVGELQTRISAAIENYLGLDTQKSLREATAVLLKLQEPALKDLEFLKTQIKVDFGDEADEIIRSLGYVKPLRGIDQESLIQLLYAFKKGMTLELKTRITEKGTNPALLDRIVGYAAALEQANLTQETLKMTTQEVSEEAAAVFNAIYANVIGICKIASKYYVSDPLKKEQFTFSRVVQRMGTAPQQQEEPVGE